MKAVTGTLPVDEEGWAFEIKWDGMRILTIIRPETAHAAEQQRHRRDEPLPRARRARRCARAVTPSSSMVKSSPSTTRGDRASAGCNIGCTSAAPPKCAAARRRYRSATSCSTFSTSTATTSRRCRTPSGGGSSPSSYPTTAAGPFRGNDLQARASRCSTRRKEQGLEGVMAKRLDSPYLPGQALAGVAEGEGASAPGVRHRRLATGRRQPRGLPRVTARRRLRGRRSAVLRQGRHRLQQSRARPVGSRCSRRAKIDASPFDPPPPRIVARVARWVRPELVAEVEFGEWTAEGILRHPSYLGLRDDKAPTDVVREG